MIDVERLSNVVSELYVSRLAEYYGVGATEALGRLVETVRAAYRYLPYEGLGSSFVVVAATADQTPVIDGLGTPVASSLAELPKYLGEPLVIDVGPPSVRIWVEELTDLDELTLEGMVYCYEGQDTFRLPGESLVIDLGTGYASVFALPTFFELDELLSAYGEKVARRSRCKVLASCWDDEGRLVFVNRPEAIMRDSLTQYLRHTLREHETIEVRVEQIVDESHPVDIKVQWLLSNRSALIEVKWIGDSWNPEKTATLAYRDQRAREGALQLADYLEANLDHTSGTVTLGYLVIFDGRRRGLTVPLGEISADDASYYRDREVEFDPKYEELRSDFRPPLRLFMAHRVLA